MEIKVEKVKATVMKLHFKVFQKELIDHFLKLKTKTIATVTDQQNLQKVKLKNQTQSDQLVSEQVKKSFLNKVMNNRCHWAFRQMKLQPLSQVHFDYSIWNEKNDFEFSAQFEVAPEIKEVKIEKINLGLPKSQVTDTMIDAAIENMRKLKQSFKPVLEKRPIRISDIVTVDVEAFQGKTAAQGGSSKNLRIEIKATSAQSKTEDSQLERKLIGQKVGQTVNFDFTYPKNFPNQLWAGLTISFKVQIKSVETAILPELNDQFVHSVFIDRISGKMAFAGLPKTVQDLRKYVKKEIQFLEKNNDFLEKREKLLNKLVDLNPVEIPQGLLAKQIQALTDFEKRKLSQTKSAGDVENQIKANQTEIQKTAKKMVGAALIIDFLAKKNSLTCLPVDIENYLGEKTRLSGEPREKLRLMMQNPTWQSQVKFEIVQDKVVNFIFDQLKTKKSA